MSAEDSPEYWISCQLAENKQTGIGLKQSSFAFLIGKIVTDTPETMNKDNLWC